MRSNTGRIRGIVTYIPLLRRERNVARIDAKYHAINQRVLDSAVQYDMTANRKKNVAKSVFRWDIQATPSTNPGWTAKMDPAINPAIGERNIRVASIETNTAFAAWINALWRAKHPGFEPNNW